ncbi:MAG: hypothetical protein Q7V58_12425 [Actinomycetota bacterium]|nr:hypothetical protein [Actinomycetota bacterium]
MAAPGNVSFVRGRRVTAAALCASLLAFGAVAGAAAPAVGAALTAAEVEARLLTPQEAATAAAFTSALSTYSGGANTCVSSPYVECVRTWVSDDYAHAYPYFLGVTALATDVEARERLAHVRESVLASTGGAILLAGTSASWAISVPSSDGATDAVHAAAVSGSVLVRASCTGFHGQVPVASLRTCAEAVVTSQASRFASSSGQAGGVPTSTGLPVINRTTLEPGDVASSSVGFWTSATPITKYEVTWLSCPSAKTGTSGCKAVKRGEGSYRVTPKDVGRSLMVQVVAQNKAGKSSAILSSKTFPVVPGRPVVVPAEWAPRKSGSSWTFPATMQAIERWLSSTRERITVELVAVGQGANKIPGAFGNDIDANDIFRVSPAPGSTIVGTPDKPGKLRVYFYEESLRGCPSTKTFKKWFALANHVPMWQVTSLLDRNKCPWRVEWSDDTTQLTAANVDVFAIEPTAGGGSTSVAVLTVDRPSVEAGLRLQFAIPDATYRQQNPEYATLTTDLGLVAFAGTLSAFEVSAIQANTGFGVAGVQFEVFGPDGFRRISANGGRSSSVVLTGGFGQTGSVRVLATVEDRNGVHYQAYADIAVTGPNGVAGGPDVTMLDGRCMSASGQSMSCFGPTYLPVTKLAASLRQKSGLVVPGGLNGMDVIKYVTDAGHPLKVLVANASLSSGAGRSGVRAVACAWYDLVCHLGNLLGINATTIPKVAPPQGKATAKKPAPAVLQRNVQLMPGGAPVAGVAAGGCLALGGGAFVCSGLSIDPQRTGLSASSLVGMDGATLIGPDGATLVGPDGGTLVARTLASLIGPDGATLVGMDGATLVGLDGGTLVGPDGATLVGVSPAFAQGVPALGVLGFN